MESREKRGQFFRAALCLVMVIVVTRGVSLTHNFLNTPDEHVFTFSTETLLDSLLSGEQYEPYKPYPEGTYVFRLPFQLLARHVALTEDYSVNVRIWGRIASVFYYTLGALLGLWLVQDPLRGGRAGMRIYVPAIGFGLFQIEQSRYGTFDPVSFPLVMLIIASTVCWLRKGRLPWLLGAAFCAGAAAAGKYPLAYFFLLPAAALFLRGDLRRKRLPVLAAMALCLLGGFLLFSPSVVLNPGFLALTIKKELLGYAVNGNPEGYSTPPESALSTLLYHLLYADLPLAPLWAAAYVGRTCKGGETDAERRFCFRTVPAVSLGFLAYNLFVKTFFFRTLFPWFCVSLLYASAGLAAFCRDKKRRAAAVLLCVLMIGRGALLLSLLGDRDGGQTAAASLAESVSGCEIDEVVAMGGYFQQAAFSGGLPMPTKTIGIDKLYEGQFPALEPGTLLVTDSIEGGWVKPYVFPIRDGRVRNMLEGWERFKTENADCLRAKLYPDWIYPAFGYRLHGSTATNYEFPANWLYYRPMAVREK